VSSDRPITSLLWPPLIELSGPPAPLRLPPLTELYAALDVVGAPLTELLVPNAVFR